MGIRLPAGSLHLNAGGVLLAQAQLVAADGDLQGVSQRGDLVDLADGR